MIYTRIQKNSLCLSTAFFSLLALSYPAWAVDSAALTIGDFTYTDQAVQISDGHLLTSAEISLIRSNGCFQENKCTALGYKQNVTNCTKTLKCPYDTSYEICIDVQDCSSGLYTAEDCETRGGVQGQVASETLLDGTKCYTCLVGCPTGYITKDDCSELPGCQTYGQNHPGNQDCYPYNYTCPDGYVQESECSNTLGDSQTVGDDTKGYTQCYECLTGCPSGQYTADDCYSQGDIPTLVKTKLSDGTQCYECSNCSTKFPGNILVNPVPDGMECNNAPTCVQFEDKLTGNKSACIKQDKVCADGYEFYAAGKAAPNTYSCWDSGIHYNLAPGNTEYARCCKQLECTSGTELYGAGETIPDDYGCTDSAKYAQCCAKCNKDTSQYTTLEKCKNALTDTTNYACIKSGFCYVPTKNAITLTFKATEQYQALNYNNGTCYPGTSSCTQNPYQGYRLEITKPDGTEVKTTYRSSNEEFSSQSGKHNICVYGTGKNLYYKSSSQQQTGLKRTFAYIAVTSGRGGNYYLCPPNDSQNSAYSSTKCSSTDSSIIRPSSSSAGSYYCWNSLELTDILDYFLTLYFTN